MLLNSLSNYDIIKEKAGIRINIMNKNAIISLAMLYSLWQTKHNDLLDLIRPFILFAVGMTTKTNGSIDIDAICRYMESEFGYQSFQPAVVERILLRETSNAIPVEKRVIKKENRQFILIASLADHVEKFSSKRIVCKEHSDAVTRALAVFLNKNRACKKDNYTSADAEKHLLSFFEQQGGTIVLSADDLRQISFKNNELDFFIGKFILEEDEKHSLIMDYIVELVKGYFVTTALYLQAENLDVTHASFSNVTFYLDTPLLLALLGFKSSQENISVQEMVKSLHRSGAKLACFSYNIEEVDSILEAYKQATLSPQRSPSNVTLEFFDEQGASYSRVDIAQKSFVQKLRNNHIEGISFDQALNNAGATGQTAGLLNDNELKAILLKMNPNYNISTLPDDLTAINTVSRVRRNRKLPNIEKCKAVFVTSNPLLVSGTKQLLSNCAIDVGFPLVITGNDLCVLAWLKDFKQSNNLPKMRLLENVLAVITPSKDLMDAYFDNLSNLEQHGEISGDEAALLRVDQFARKELMEITKGEKKNLDASTIYTIRENMLSESRKDGIKDGIKEGIKIGKDEQKQSLTRRACKKAEDEVTPIYERKERRWIATIKALLVLFALLFVAASCYTIATTGINNIFSIAAVIISIVTLIQGIPPFFAKDTWVIRYAKRTLQRRKFRAIDEKKRTYLSVLEEQTQEDSD